MAALISQKSTSMESAAVVVIVTALGPPLPLPVVNPAEAPMESVWSTPFREIDPSAILSAPLSRTWTVLVPVAGAVRA